MRAFGAPSVVSPHRSQVTEMSSVVSAPETCGLAALIYKEINMLGREGFCCVEVIRNGDIN